MANLGAFSPYLRDKAWLNPLALPEGWYEGGLYLTHPLIAAAVTGAAYTEALETDTALGFGVKVGYGPAIETDSALGTAVKVGYGFGSETDSAGIFSAGSPYTAAIEIDSARGFGVLVVYGAAIETDSARGTAVKTGIGVAQETDTAGSFIDAAGNVGKPVDNPQAVLLGVEGTADESQTEGKAVLVEV